MTSHSRPSPLTATFSSFCSERSLVEWAVYLVAGPWFLPSFPALLFFSSDEVFFCGAGFF